MNVLGTLLAVLALIVGAIVTGAGFTRFKRALQTPFNLVYEARP